jgi:hypothetical protein
MNGHYNKRGRNQRRRQGVNPNRALDSNGPDVRIRGTAQQIYDKYLALARDAASSGDRVKAENYLQHAEHYFRVLRAIQGPQAQPADSATDVDGDGEQPSLAEPRDQREPRQQQAPGAYDGEETEAGPASERPAEANGPNGAGGPDRPGEHRAHGGDFEGRRRRRRPRRPREDQDGEPDAGEDAPSETVAG